MPRASRRATIVSLGLVAGSLGLLAWGGFVRLDDASGSGGEASVLLGGVAGLVAVGGVLVGLTRRTARRSVGAALAVLTLVLVAGRFDDGFRFVWAADEGELLLLTVGLGLVALVLLTPRFTNRSTSGAPQLSTWARVAAYAVGTVVATFAAFAAGVDHDTRTECAGSDGDCDLGVLTGFLWAGVTLLVVAAAIGTLELARARRRRALPGGTMAA